MSVSIVAPLASSKRSAIADALISAYEALKDRAQREWAYFVTAEELRRLSDRSLADLGIAREDIPAFARRTVEA